MEQLAIVAAFLWNFITDINVYIAGAIVWKLPGFVRWVKDGFPAWLQKRWDQM